MSTAGRFSKEEFIPLCNELAVVDEHFQQIIDQYGYAPCWSRTPTFATLIHIILEQQVSLASAKAAFDKLQSYIGIISPEKILHLSDQEMKACYFSRQKIVYARSLSEAVLTGDLHLESLVQEDDNTIRTTLTKVKGIGNWTVDVFLMMCLHSADIFPLGDIALVNSLKHIKQLPLHTTKEELLPFIEPWKPYRTVAAYLLWHAYICRKGIVFQSA
jgi:DNA-3-methyladenine glycosylase II